MSNKFFWFNFLVNFEDIDWGGVVHHPNYFKFCERARHNLLNDCGYSPELLYQNQTAFSVAKSECIFKKPLMFGKNYWIKTFIEKRRGAHLFLDQQIFEDKKSDSKPLFLAKFHLVFVELNPLVVKDIPAQLQLALGVV